MAVKNANVTARVEPEIKEQAEAIFASLGVPVSTVINMLYRQTIRMRGIPFSVRLPVERPRARDEMTDEELDAMLAQAIEDVKAGRTQPAEKVFGEIRKEFGYE